MGKLCLTIFVGLFFIQSSFAQPSNGVFVLDSLQDSSLEAGNIALLNASVQVLWLETMPTDIKKVLEIDQKVTWKAIAQIEQTWLQKRSQIWAKVQIRNTCGFDKELVLYVSGRYVNFADVYFVDAKGNITHKRAGVYVETQQKDIPQDRNYSKVRVRLSNQQTQTFYVKLSNIDKKPLELSFRLQTERHWSQEIFWRNLWQGILQGGFLILAIYTFFIYLQNGQKEYVFYITYLLATAVYFLNFYGFIGEFVLPKSPFAFNYIYLISTSSVNLLYLGFVRVLLKTRENIPAWDRWFIAWMWFRGIEAVAMLLILAWQFDFNLVHALHRFFVIPETAAFIIFQFGLFDRNNKLTHYVVIGTFFLQAGILASILSSNFFPSFSGIVNYFFQAGTMTQIVFFAIGLGYKIRQNEVQKQTIQAELIEQLRKNEELQSKLNQELEEEVKKRTLEIESQSMILRRQNRDILESIEYAQKIQEAILPSNDEIQRYLPESFILYKPKDIVSGDFYWFSHLQHKTFIAVVDCTGHGVPGAFMSLITNELLNEIIDTQQIHQPDLIFDELRVGIRRNLNQDRTKNVDGLVISLCVINHAEQQAATTVQIGNSYNPVFYALGNDLFEIKADRIQIGGFSFISGQAEKPFTTKTITIEQPTTFYLSTDGLPDQFGGVQGKKFTYKKFKTLALAIQNLPLAQQRVQIYHSLTDWMLEAAEFQTDDILVMGFQVLPNS